MTIQPSVPLDDPRALGNELVSPQAFADDARIHRTLSALRELGSPVWVTPDNYRPFWAVTRHAQILEVSSNNEVFISSRRLNLMSRLQEAAAFKGAERYGKVLRTLVHMDEPDHRAYRAVTQGWFTGSAVRQQQGMLDALALEFSAKFEGRDTLDFAAEVATLYPLRVIMAILGVPQEDLPLMHRLTKTLSAPQDPEFGTDIERGDSMFDSIPEFTAYFLQMIEDRRRHPRDDLASVIANGQVHGRPMGELETVSYFITMAVAGHDTTAAAMAGGCHALAERPEQWARLRTDPALRRTAADEMIRWATPIRHFMRTATRDYGLGGRTIRAGESLCLYYLSANRDAEVFAEPFAFKIDRTHNRHLSFGFGPHVCLGMALSRLELAAWFSRMLAQVESFELAGPVRFIETNFLSGYKSVPIRYRLAA